VDSTQQNLLLQKVFWDAQRRAFFLPSACPVIDRARSCRPSSPPGARLVARLELLHHPERRGRAGRCAGTITMHISSQNGIWEFGRVLTAGCALVATSYPVSAPRVGKSYQGHGCVSYRCPCGKYGFVRTCHPGDMKWRCGRLRNRSPKGARPSRFTLKMGQSWTGDESMKLNRSSSELSVALCAAIKMTARRSRNTRLDCSLRGPLKVD
jgi:hypothetical protein